MATIIFLSTFTGYQRIRCLVDDIIAFFDDYFSILHYKRMMKILTLIMLFSLIACQRSNGSSSDSGMSDHREAVESETLTREFMILVNSHRKSIGLNSLEHVDSLSMIALDHSYNMATKVVTFGHTGFSARCAEARVDLSGGNLCAENVASGQRTAEAVFTSWMNSPSHRGNIESPRLSHCGLGIAQSESGSLYWTHLFLEKK